VRLPDLILFCSYPIQIMLQLYKGSYNAKIP
jgi:hypothetical protein